MNDESFEVKNSPISCRMLKAGDEAQIKYRKATKNVIACELINKSETVKTAENDSEGAISEKDYVNIDDKTYYVE